MISELEKTKLYTCNYTINELINIIKKGLILYNSPKIINDIATLETNKYREIINILEKDNLEYCK